MRPKMIEDLLHLPHALALRFAISCGEVFKEDDEENVSQNGQEEEEEAVTRDEFGNEYPTHND
jgi:hypothetical protein